MTMRLNAYVGGYSAPKEEPRTAINSGGSETNFSTVILPPVDATKPFATCQAKAAISGHTLHPHSGGGFLLGSCGDYIEFGTLTAVDAFLNRVGGNS